MASSVRLVSGYNGTPIPLDAIAPPLLKDYKGGETVQTEWHDYVSRELDGNRNWVSIGLPWTRWKFFRLSRAEYALLSTYSGPVTIVTLNQTTGVYHSYNGKWKPAETNSGDAKWTPDGLPPFPDPAFDILDLVQIS